MSHPVNIDFQKNFGFEVVLSDSGLMDRSTLLTWEERKGRKGKKKKSGEPRRAFTDCGALQKFS